jgi:lipopolysaccharide export system permease protein
MKLYLHIIRSHIGPFFFSFFTLMFIFLLQFIMKFVDQLVGKGLSAWIIGELIILNLAWMVVLAVPMSVLVATLMGYGSMSSHNEITAMKASGMSLYRMMAPVLVLAVLLTYACIEFNNKILPEANHRAKNLIVDIRRKKPTLTITQGLFSQEIPGYSILARKTFEASNDLEGITIYDYTEPSNNVVVTAKKGIVSFTPDFRKLIMDLQDGEIHQVNSSEPALYRKLRYTKHRIVMDVEGFDFERTAEGELGRGDRELSAQIMLRAVDSMQQLNENSYQEIKTLIVQQGTYYSKIINRPQQINAILQHLSKANPFFTATTQARNTSAMVENQLLSIQYNQERIHEFLVEIHKKYSIPVACIVFVFLGAPLGIMARRGTFGVAATLSFGFFLMYWACLIGGEKLADRGIITPWVGMWIANIILGILGIYLTIRSAQESPRIQWTVLRRFVPKTLRTPEQPEHDIMED